MAIYHYSVKAINRSSGRSSVAAAAYRAGEKLVDERTGNVFDYERRNGVVHAEVFLPDGTTMPRADLWNLAEASEKRKDAKVAREIVVALPHELTAPEQRILIREYAQGLSQRTGWAVDVAVHAPGDEGDQRNSHAHLLCTTRVVERNAQGKIQLGAKTREWDVVSSGKELIRSERQEWEVATNQALEQAQQAARVDARSYAEQGLDLMPQTHLGVNACQMERKGIETERGNRNRLAAEHNREVADLAQKREEREAAEALKNDITRWEGMQPWSLRDEGKKIHPGSVREVAMDDPAVWEAYKPIRDYDEFPRKQFRHTYDEYRAGEFGWLNTEHMRVQESQVSQTNDSVRYARKQEQAWVTEHPYQRMLCDMGVPNKTYNSLKRHTASKEHELAAESEKLKVLKAERAKAEAKLESAIQKALPWVKPEYARRQERYEALQAVLAPKDRAYQLEREKERSQERGGGRSIGF